MISERQPRPGRRWTRAEDAMRHSAGLTMSPSPPRWHLGDAPRAIADRLSRDRTGRRRYRWKPTAYFRPQRLSNSFLQEKREAGGGHVMGAKPTSVEPPIGSAVLVLAEAICDAQLIVA